MWAVVNVILTAVTVVACSTDARKLVYAVDVASMSRACGCARTIVNIVLAVVAVKASAVAIASVTATIVFAAARSADGGVFNAFVDVDAASGAFPARSAAADKPAVNIRAAASIAARSTAAFVDVRIAVVALPTRSAFA